MDFHEAVEFLSKETGVKVFQVRMSFMRTKALGGIELDDADFKLSPSDPGDIEHCCGGKVPVMSYNLFVKDGKKKRMLTVYTYGFSHHGMPKCSITTSPEKIPKIDVVERDEVEHEEQSMYPSPERSEFKRICLQIDEIHKFS